LDPVVKAFGSTLEKEIRKNVETDGKERCDVKEDEGSVLVMGVL
jgi:hypothetical protein